MGKHIKEKEDKIIYHFYPIRKEYFSLFLNKVFQILNILFWKSCLTPVTNALWFFLDSMGWRPRPRLFVSSVCLAILFVGGGLSQVGCSVLIVFLLGLLNLRFIGIVAVSIWGLFLVVMCNLFVYN